MKENLFAPQHAADNCQGLPAFALRRLDAAKYLQIHPNSLDRLVKRGLIRPSRALRCPLFPITELQRFLEQTR